MIKTYMCRKPVVWVWASKQLSEDQMYTFICVSNTVVEGKTWKKVFLFSELEQKL